MKRARQAALPAKIGMILSVIGGVLLLAVFMFLKFLVRALAATDGVDDQDHLAWWMIIAQFLLPAVIFFLVFCRLNRKAVDQVRIGMPEVVIYGLGAAACLVPLVPNLMASSSLIMLALPVLLIWALFLNQKL